MTTYYDQIPVLPDGDGEDRTIKVCGTCRIPKEHKYFSVNKTNPDGLQTYCKSCRNEYAKNERHNEPKRRALKKRATPKWYEDDKIKLLYKKKLELSELWGMKLHVDHIVPLTSDIVCGLHCWDNLQILESSLNLSKSNRYNDWVEKYYETDYF